MSLISPNVTAFTLSVLLHENDSVFCYVILDNETCNLTLRLENDKARLAGYPNSWKTWDEKILGSEGLTYQDAENDGSIDSFIDEIEAMDAYVSRETEAEIFKKLKESLKKQFEDEMFANQLTESQKQIALSKIDLAIKNLA